MRIPVDVRIEGATGFILRAETIGPVIRGLRGADRNTGE